MTTEKVDPNYNKAAKTAEDELVERGGVCAALVRLARNVRGCAAQLASDIEGVAWAMDREQRGALAVGARSDEVELAHTIVDLLNDPLLTGRGSHYVRDKVLEHLQPKPPEPAPAPAASPAPAAATGGLVVTSNGDLVYLHNRKPAKRKPRKARRARR